MPHPCPTPNKGNKGKKKYIAGDSAPAGDGRSAGTRKQPDPNVKVLVDLWHDTYVATHGSKPPVNGAKCGQVAKAILRGRPLGEARWLIQEFFRNPPQFYADRNLWGMEHILSAAPTLLARTNKPKEFA